MRLRLDALLGGCCGVRLPRAHRASRRVATWCPALLLILELIVLQVDLLQLVDLPQGRVVGASDQVLATVGEVLGPLLFRGEFLGELAKRRPLGSQSAEKLERLLRRVRLLLDLWLLWRVRRRRSRLSTEHIRRLLHVLLAGYR